MARRRGRGALQSVWSDCCQAFSSVCALWLCGSGNTMPGSSLFPTIDDVLKERLKRVF